MFTWDDTITEKGQTTRNADLTHESSPILRLHVKETSCGQATHHLVLTVDNGNTAVTVAINVTVTSQICVR